MPQKKNLKVILCQYTKLCAVSYEMKTILFGKKSCVKIRFFFYYTLNVANYTLLKKYVKSNYFGSTVNTFYN